MSSFIFYLTILSLYILLASISLEKISKATYLFYSLTVDLQYYWFRIIDSDRATVSSAILLPNNNWPSHVTSKKKTQTSHSPQTPNPQEVPLPQTLFKKNSPSRTLRRIRSCALVPPACTTSACTQGEAGRQKNSASRTALGGLSS